MYIGIITDNARIIKHIRNTLFKNLNKENFGTYVLKIITLVIYPTNSKIILIINVISGENPIFKKKYDSGKIER